MRQEMRLGITEAEEKVDVLKAEVKQEVAQLKVELAAKAVGAGVSVAGALALVASLILLLAQVMPPWIAALLVALAALGGGALLLRKPVHVTNGVQPRELVPERTVESLRTDARTIKEATK